MLPLRGRVTPRTRRFQYPCRSRIGCQARKPIGWCRPTWPVRRSGCWPPSSRSTAWAGPERDPKLEVPYGVPGGKELGYKFGLTIDQIPEGDWLFSEYTHPDAVRQAETN